MTLRELRKKRNELRMIFEAQGGRGVELADEIDEIEAEIQLRECPIDFGECLEIVLKLAEAYVEEVGEPEDDSIADTEILRRKITEHAIERVKKRRLAQVRSKGAKKS